MNAPVRIQIDDATKRKADMWEEVSRGELSRDEAKLIDMALSHFAESREHEALLLREYAPAANQYRAFANRARTLQNKLTSGGNLYLGEG